MWTWDDVWTIAKCCTRFVSAAIVGEGDYPGHIVVLVRPRFECIRMTTVASVQEEMDNQAPLGAVIEVRAWGRGEEP